MFWVKYFLIAGVMRLAENKVLLPPPAPGSDGKCSDPATYLHKTVKLCCSLCKPGFRLKNACSDTSDTVCQKCNEGTVLATPNYSKNCFRCSRCQEDMGLIYTRNCSSSADATCACRTGTYCIMRDRDHRCKECRELTRCPPGEGVSKQGTDDSDVSCSPCPDGTFSDKASYTETCQQHTDCESQGGRTVRPGNATSDRVCVLTTGTPITTTTITTTTSGAPSTASTHATSNTFTTADRRTAVSISKSKTPPLDSVAIIVGAVLPVAFLLGLIVFLAVCFKRNRGDTNNNIKKETNKPLHCTSVHSPQDCFPFNPPEKLCLLGGKDSSNPSLSSSSSGRTDQRSLLDPEPSAQSCGPVIHSSQEGSVCHDSLQASNSAVTLKISATFSCHLSPGTHLCPVPTSPVIDSTPSSSSLPLSKEEERQNPTKEAQAAVQESGKVVC
ncbi:tumor necrosis factor receptor superfamily member 1B-like [Anguilla rostrata]|uniref:tumor necrosis factor receptor superfamily member 1B-like n=1 Tax=Anguilla rostrata TaxID=7938 RepID=UPI0030CE005B